MKKKMITMALTAVFVLSQPVCSFAAASPGTSAIIGGNSSDGDSVTSFVYTSSSNSQSAAFTASTSAGKDTIQIAVGQPSGATETSVTVQTNSRGQAVIGDTALEFVQGSNHSVVGLPETVVNSINGINSGQQLEVLISDVDLSGYNALIGTHAIMTKTANTNVEKTGDVEFPLYVPNLIDGLGTVQVLFYDNIVGKWKLITPNKIDIASKTLWVTVSGSGTLSVVYKR